MKHKLRINLKKLISVVTLSVFVAAGVMKAEPGDDHDWPPKTPGWKFKQTPQRPPDNPPQRPDPPARKDPPPRHDPPPQKDPPKKDPKKGSEPAK
jgi:hypothetical protein